MYILRCIVFLMDTFYTVSKKATIKSVVLKKSGQLLCKIPVKEKLIFNKIARERPAARLERNYLYFLNILSRFWATLHFFPEFSELFCRKPFIVCLWFKWYNDLCNVTLHVSRKCWKTLWIDSSVAFINDIPPKRTKCHLSGLIFKAFSFYVGKI